MPSVAGITPCIRCLTIQSDALPVPQHENALPSLRQRNRSALSFGNRRRLDSECGQCYTNLDASHNMPPMATTLFPEVMLKSKLLTICPYRLQSCAFSTGTSSSDGVSPVPQPAVHRLVPPRAVVTAIDESHHHAVRVSVDHGQNVCMSLTLNDLSPKRVQIQRLDCEQLEDRLLRPTSAGDCRLHSQRVGEAEDLLQPDRVGAACDCLVGHVPVFAKASCEGDSLAH